VSRRTPVTGDSKAASDPGTGSAWVETARKSRVPVAAAESSPSGPEVDTSEPAAVGSHTQWHHETIHRTQGIMRQRTAVDPRTCSRGEEGGDAQRSQQLERQCQDIQEE
jgi:hypothetical protein